MGSRWRSLGVVLAAGLAFAVVSGLAQSWAQDYPAYFFSVVSAGCVVALAAGLVRIRRGGQTVAGVIGARCRDSRQRIAGTGLRARAPGGAGIVALGSAVSVIVPLVATSGPGHRVQLPPAADAWTALWCTGAAALITVVGVDAWCGAGTVVRALAADRFTPVSVAVSLIVAVAGPLMILDHVTGQWIWLTLIPVQLAWGLGAPLAGTLIASHRTQPTPEPSTKTRPEPGQQPLRPQERSNRTATPGTAGIGSAPFAGTHISLLGDGIHSDEDDHVPVQIGGYVRVGHGSASHAL